MAQPIPFAAPPRKSDGPVDAVDAAVELLQLLNDRGVLSLLRGLIDAGDEVIEILVRAVNTPEAIGGIRNFLLLTKFFASIPPDVLHSLVQTAVTGAEREKGQHAPSLLQLLRRLNSDNTRHALAVTLDLVESVGKGL